MLHEQVYKINLLVSKMSNTQILLKYFGVLNYNFSFNENQANYLMKKFDVRLKLVYNNTI